MQHINRERESSLGFPDLLIFFLKKDKAISIMVLILKYEHQGSSESSLSPDVSEHPTTPVQNAWNQYNLISESRDTGVHIVKYTYSVNNWTHQAQSQLSNLVPQPGIRYTEL